MPHRITHAPDIKSSESSSQPKGHLMRFLTSLNLAVVLVSSLLTQAVFSQAPTSFGFHPNSALVEGATMSPSDLDVVSFSAFDLTQFTVAPAVPAPGPISVFADFITSAESFFDAINFDSQLDAWYGFTSGSFDLGASFGRLSSIIEQANRTDYLVVMRQEFQPQVITGNLPYTQEALDLIAQINSPTPTVAGVLGDLNCDSMANIADCVYFLDFLFSGGPAPISCGTPIPTSGIDLDKLYQFVDVYGSHYVSSVTRGHMVFAHIQVMNRSSATSSQVSAWLNTALQGPGGGLSTGFTYQEAIDALNTQTHFSVEVRGSGGGGLQDLAGLIGIQGPEDLVNIQANLQNYISGLTFQNASRVGYTLSKIPALPTQEIDDIAFLSFQRLDCLAELGKERRFADRVLQHVSRVLNSYLSPAGLAIPPAVVDQYLSYAEVYGCFTDLVEQLADTLILTDISQVPTDCPVPNRFDHVCNGQPGATLVPIEVFDLDIDNLAQLLVLADVGELPAAVQKTMDAIIDATAIADPLSTVSVAYLEGLTSLDLTGRGISNLYPLSFLTNLQELNLNNNPDIPGSQLVHVASLPNLRVLELAYSDIDSISALQGTTTLQHLRLSHNPLHDLSGIEGNSDLRRIEVVNVSGLYDVDELMACPRLEIFNAAGAVNLTSIGGLGMKPFLRRVTVGNTGATSLLSLQTSPLLEYLYIAGMNASCGALQGAPLVEALASEIHSDLTLSGQGVAIRDFLNSQGLAAEFQNALWLVYPGTNWESFLLTGQDYEGICKGGQLFLGCQDGVTHPSEAATIQNWRSEGWVAYDSLINWTFNVFPPAIP